MTEPRIDIDAEMKNPDLLLITDYLIGELDPAQLAAVTLRLKEDSVFREYCAPILLAWSVPPKHVRSPMPRVELERHWNDFTKRAGFAHQRRLARKRWLTILGVVLAIGVVSTYTLKDRVSAWYRDRRDYHTFAYAPGWVPIAEGREVQFGPKASIRLANKPDVNDVIGVKVVGEVRFRSFNKDSIDITPTLRLIGVSTSAGNAMGFSGEFTVRAIADTMEVVVHHPSKRQFVGFMPMPNYVFVTGTNGGAIDFKIYEGESARIIRGGKPVKLP